MTNSRRNWKKWGSEEDAILIEYYPKEGWGVISRLPIPRTKSSIEGRAHFLRLRIERKKPRNSDRLWSDEEVEILNKYYPTEGTKVQKRLPNRSATSITQQAHLRGIKTTTKNKWSEEEIRILKEEYPTMGVKIIDKLNNKSRQSICMKASSLGIKNMSKSSRYKTKETKDFIIKNYPELGSRKCAEILGVSIPYVRSIASKFGIRTTSHDATNIRISKNAKKVRCIETGIVYNSMRDVYKQLRINVFYCLHGTCKTAGGYHWEYAE